jgi:hypothetical protein
MAFVRRAVRPKAQRRTVPVRRLRHWDDDKSDPDDRMIVNRIRKPSAYRESGVASTRCDSGLFNLSS